METFVSHSGIWSTFHQDFLEIEIKRLKKKALWQDKESAKDQYVFITLLENCRGPFLLIKISGEQSEVAATGLWAKHLYGDEEMSS